MGHRHSPSTRGLLLLSNPFTPGGRFSGDLVSGSGVFVSRSKSSSGQPSKNSTSQETAGGGVVGVDRQDEADTAGVMVRIERNNRRASFGLDRGRGSCQEIIVDQ